ncbi:hypothetical protein CDAR_40311 [Caerostris darwini]|uniref:Uncharacterized protein n=1 Tax=Caerostris darwini TaxID=1538125 RepID=A0AAV4R904_9ARAC|nr:hypothetical protein CDAR_40311 [Caerostris darwini]
MKMRIGPVAIRYGKCPSGSGERGEWAGQGGRPAVCNQDRWGTVLSPGCTGPSREEPQCFKSSSDAGRSDGD